jgi:hypothetical protein
VHTLLLLLVVVVVEVVVGGVVILLLLLAWLLRWLPHVSVPRYVSVLCIHLIRRWCAWLVV